MQVVERPVVGLCGDAQGWTSLGRTLPAYEAALAERYTVVRVSSVDEVRAANAAAVVNFSGSVGWLARAYLGIPVIVCLHGGGTVNSEELPALLGLLGPGDTVIGNCAGDVDLVRHLARGAAPRVEQMSLPVGDQFQYRSPQSLLEALEVPAGARVVGFVARATPKKGLHHVVSTVNWLLWHSPHDVYGIVTGDFSEDSFLDFRGQTYREYVFGLMSALGVADRICILPGDLPVDVLTQVYSAIDVLVHPSTSIDENFGYSPREALACGASAVVTDYGGFRNADLDIPEVRRVPTWATAGGIRFDRALLFRDVRDLLTVGRPKRRRLVATGDRDFARSLHRAVDRHLRAARPADGRCAVPTGLARLPSCLPVTRPDWSVVRGAAQFYVSGGEPYLDDLWQAWPATRRTDGIRIEDPAWPATSEVSDAEWEVYRRVRDLGAARLRDPGLCARLVEVGALVPASWR